MIDLFRVENKKLKNSSKEKWHKTPNEVTSKLTTRPRFVNN